MSFERSRFQRKHRLNSAVEYNNVFKTACRSRDSQFIVLAVKNGKPYPRLGLAISRKSVKTAVFRNKVKRTVRESFRERAKTLSGLDIVVLAEKRINPKVGRLLRQSLCQHWQRILRCGD